MINAIWVYNLTVASGHFDVLRRSFEKVSPDQRIQAIIIAFCFGALLEALAGFGTPVAITVVMLMALGFQPVKAAAVALIANTAPVAFGALATPIVTLATVTSGASNDPGLTVDNLGAMVGRQTPILAVIVPLILVFVVDGRRGLGRPGCRRSSAAWPSALAQFVASNYISVPLADIVASLVAAAAVVAAAAGLDARADVLAAEPAAGTHRRTPATADRSAGSASRTTSAGPGLGRRSTATAAPGPRQRRRRGPRLRAVPRHHRDLLDHQHLPSVKAFLAEEPWTLTVRLARADDRSARRRPGVVDRRSRSTGCPRPAR